MSLISKIYALILYSVGGVVDLLNSFVLFDGISLGYFVLAGIFVGMLFSFLRGGSND